MIFWKTVEAVAVFWGLGVVGFILLARKTMAKEALSTLSFLALDLAVPALIFYDMMTHFDPERFALWWVSPLSWVGSFVFLGMLSWVFSRFFRAEGRREVFVSLLYPNAIFFPLILLPVLFPNRPEITVEVFLFTMLFSFFLFQPFGFLYGTKKRLVFDSGHLFSPLIVLLIGALVIHYAGVRPLVPAFLVDLARRIGALSIPLLLFVLGGNVYLDRMTDGKQPVRLLLAFVVVKNVVFPLIHLFLVGLLPISPTLRFFVFLQSALPPVTALPVMVERENGNRQLVQAFFLWSVLALVVTLPFWLWAYDRVYGL